MSFSKDNDLYHNADENRYKEIRENINQAKKKNGTNRKNI